MGTFLHANCTTMHLRYAEELIIFIKPLIAIGAIRRKERREKGDERKTRRKRTELEMEKGRRGIGDWMRERREEVGVEREG